MRANLLPVLFAIVVLALTFAPKVYILGAAIVVPLVALAAFALVEYIVPNGKHRPRGPKYTVPQDTLQR